MKELIQRTVIHLKIERQSQYPYNTVTGPVQRDEFGHVRFCREIAIFLEKYRDYVGTDGITGGKALFARTRGSRRTNIHSLKKDSRH